MDIQSLTSNSSKVLQAARELVENAKELDITVKHLAQQPGIEGMSPFMIGLTVFILACFVGYYVVWKVTPALHSPLMSVTNAISSVIIVGALIAAGPAVTGISTTFGFFAVVLASINIFGGFIVTQRMLKMFAKK
ncbi:NAD(P) transhydrogenase subunit alpha [Candidatus Finniella inopinata]|uniref:proton-translocating NAD(P)(+) transhydrogenase n=1 Tax=Candidatus Finniella inopinata TaxID=1696036 RepID=A0A4Q7DJC1_9PROT|nr:NAD(P) transhydrogenase subunit alpha [Candidatus Finniella inopinata]RZI46842.1 NAD(P) transhydrogenase subunit alpha [Candidatus Finniella inopinata]